MTDTAARPVTHGINVGDGATLAWWSDRTGCTVIDVTRTTVLIQEDTAIRIDNNGMSDAQTYRHVHNPDGRVHKVRMTRRGWRVGGRNGNAVGFNGRSTYHDFTF